MNLPRYRPGEWLGARFEIVKAIRGGVGEVYLCIDRQINKPLALKCLQSRYASMPRFREAFRHEAQTWIDLGRHPNIVPCLVGQEFYNEPFLVLEWIFGPDGGEPDLGKRMRGQPMALRQVIEIAIDVARGLRDAALRVPSIVHCDLKPSNILIGAESEALITDFGMARSAIAAGVEAPDDEAGRDFNPAMGGTPRYMAPEQWTRAEIDARTDVYALGCVVFEALNGHALYLGPTLADFRRQHLTGRTPVLGKRATQAETQFDELLMQCLDKDRERRPAPADLLTALTEVYRLLYNRSPPVRNVGTAPNAQDFNNRAVTFFSFGRVDEAIGLYRKALELRPVYTLARNNLAAALGARQRYDEALIELNRAIADDPASAESYVNRAVVYFDRKQPVAALADCDRAIALNPKLATAYAGRARLHQQQGRPQQAMADIEAAIAIDPLDGDFHLFQAELLQEEPERSADALAGFSRAIEIGGGSARAYLQRAALYYRAARDELAIEDLNAAIELDRTLHSAYLLRGHAQRHLWEKTRNPQWRAAAVESYSRAIELSPDRSYAAYLERGKIYSEGDQDEFAITDYNRAIGVNPDGLDAYTQRGLAYRDTKRFREAARDAEHVLKVEPGNYQALVLLGDAERRKGRSKQALFAYTRAIEVAPDRADAYVNRAEVLLERG
jgi:serine/threonine protein kinase